MAKKKEKFNFNKKSLIAFILLSIFVVSMLLIFKAPIERALNKNVNVIDFDGLVMHTIDVGQAEAIMIKLPDGKNMMIDSGNSGKEKNKKLKSYLDNNYFKNLSNKEIDYLVLTHSDRDHTGGAEMIFREFQVNTVFRPTIFSSINEQDKLRMLSSDSFTSNTQIWSDVVDAMYEEPNCEILFSNMEIKIIESEYEIEFLSPKLDSKFKNVNSYSPFIKITYKSKSILLTGDSTEESEMSALEKLSKVDILNVGHHGSKTSTSQKFLDKTMPTFATISCNSEDGNNFGHPHQEVLNRLLKIMPEKNIYRTDINGNIITTISKSGEIGFLVDVESNSYYIKIEYLIVSSVAVIFVICFACNKKSTKRNKK